MAACLNFSTGRKWPDQGLSPTYPSPVSLLESFLVRKNKQASVFQSTFRCLSVKNQGSENKTHYMYLCFSQSEGRTTNRYIYTLHGRVNVKYTVLWQGTKIWGKAEASDLLPQRRMFYIHSHIKGMADLNTTGILEYPGITGGYGKYLFVVLPSDRLQAQVVF